MKYLKETITAKEYIDTALLYRKFKFYSKAETCFLKAINIYEHQISVEKNEDIWVRLVDAYGNLALMFDENQNIGKAETYYRFAVKIMEDRIAKDKYEYVSGLVACLSCLGALIESEDCFRKAYVYAKFLPEDAICKDVIETWEDIFQ